MGRRVCDYSAAKNRNFADKCRYIGKAKSQIWWPYHSPARCNQRKLLLDEVGYRVRKSPGSAEVCCDRRYIAIDDNVEFL